MVVNQTDHIRIFSFINRKRRAETDSILHRHLQEVNCHYTHVGFKLMTCGGF